MYTKRIAAHLANPEYDSQTKCNIHYSIDGVFSFAPLYCDNPAWMKVVNRSKVFYACKECAEILAKSIQEELIKDSAIVGSVHHEEQKSLTDQAG